MLTRFCVPRLLLGASFFIVLNGLLSWAQEYSHARIVRLSFVEGAVTLQRPDVADWAAASVNTPIQEGFKLSSAENGFAEVEFENTSTARLGQLSLLEFTQLALSPAGGKINRVTLHQGYATFHLMPEAEDIYEIGAADATLKPYGKTLFRVDLEEGAARVEVFKGSLEVASPSGSTILTKNKVLELRPGAENPFEVAEGITKDAWDEWVEQRENEVAALANRHGAAPYSASGSPDTPFYGWSDLSNHGAWSYFSGYGYGWIPNVPPGWLPYSVGRWCWYPNWGYTWIAYEPWGWLPYHYGDWNFMPGHGWVWSPGGWGAWSPALVNWYQGPGWIGWTPRTRGGTPGNPLACPAGQPCATVVSMNTFQNSRPVNPRETLAIDPSQGRAIRRPDVPPGRLALLPGSPTVGPGGVPRSSDVPPSARPSLPRQGSAGASNVAGAGTPSAVRTPLAGTPAGAFSNRRSAAPEPNIVFDPVEGRFVNNPRTVPLPTLNPTNGPAQQGRSGVWGAASNGPGRPAAAQEKTAIDTLPLSPGSNPAAKAYGARGVPAEAVSSARPPSRSAFPQTTTGTMPRVTAPSADRHAAIPNNQTMHSSAPSARSAPTSTWSSGRGSSSQSSANWGSGSSGAGHSTGGGASSGSGGGGASGGGHSSGASSSGPRH